MNSYFSSWKKTEMGTIEIEIAKSPSPYVWKNLHSDVDYIPSNQYIWREMYYKYRKQMEPGFALLEDAEIRREEKEDKLLEEEDKLIEDRRRIKKQIEQEKKDMKQQFINKMYCHSLYYQPSCSLDNPFEWYSWFYP
eukprot:TRINITY_DN5428_c0_g1_i1.p4 TRINITY_DN5428_c0_g1~~TRINITY_DN5428_c0_g1_i1.p4  ORF type:complete len:137 (-),score=32.81 TRINITY_DN5428_c0_g1_i1:352-762(-)